MSEILSTQPEPAEDFLSSFMWLCAATLPSSARKAFYALPWRERSLRELLEGGAFSGVLSILETMASDRAAFDRFLHKRFEWAREGIRLVSPVDEEYPSRLRSIFQPPPVVFVRGRMPPPASCLVAIVGSRNGDIGGCAIAHQFARAIAERGGCVVSGLALGIDGAAHEGALEGGGENSTVAVLGCGVDRVYPATHDRLARRIIDQGGGILSQFEPGSQPFPSNFLDRNRVIAGMSHGVVVIQAAERSGALSTARHAMEEGRDLMVVPGGITDPRYRGSNALIKQGAYLVTSIDDVAEIVGGLTPKAAPASALNSTAGRILVLLGRGDLHYDEIAEDIDDPVAAAEAILELELSGQIERLPGNRISRTQS